MILPAGDRRGRRGLLAGVGVVLVLAAVSAGALLARPMLDYYRTYGTLDRARLPEQVVLGHHTYQPDITLAQPLREVRVALAEHGQRLVEVAPTPPLGGKRRVFAVDGGADAEAAGPGGTAEPQQLYVEGPEGFRLFVLQE